MASPTLSTLLLLGLLALVPFAFMVGTSFVKLSVVFSILRNAMGTGQVPSGTVVTALSALLSLYIMYPVFLDASDQAGGLSAQSVVAGVSGAKIPSKSGSSKSSNNQDLDFTALWEKWDKGKEPIRDFLVRNSGARERALFASLAQRGRQPRGSNNSAKATPHSSIEETDFMVALPAFLITELKEAFQMGFFIFIPFLIVDMVVANLLLALGMHMLSPTTVSLPFKLLLFVAVDGWYVLTRGLVLGYS